MQFRNRYRNRHLSLTSFGNLAAYDLRQEFFNLLLDIPGPLQSYAVLNIIGYPGSPSSPIQFWTFYWISRVPLQSCPVFNLLLNIPAPRVPIQSYPVFNLLLDIPGSPPVLSSFEHSIGYPGSPSSPIQFWTFYWIFRVPLQSYPVSSVNWWRITWSL